jgi:2-polyprenyl-3-methyl-5-hydroxy-6-metoxy-1,4-benzoquinol methylase
MEHNPCIICGGHDSDVLFRESVEKDASLSLKDRFKSTSTATFSKTGQIVRCKQCGFVFVSPLPNTGDEILEAYNEAEDTLYLKNLTAKTITFDKVMKKIEQYRSPGRLLDVGCYYGILLHAAQRRGWTVDGVELSRDAIDYARKQFGVTVFKGTLKSAAYGDSTFDVVTLLAVIEHLLDPVEELKEICRVLKKDGIIAVATHDISSLLARLMGRHYPWLCQMHLYHFSPRTMEMLLRKTGFEMIRHYSYGQVYNLGYVSERLGSSNFAYRSIGRILSLPFVARRNMTIDTRDAFLTLARKI